MKSVNRSNGPDSSQSPTFHKGIQSQLTPKKPLQPYTPLRVYTEEELAVLIQRDPSFMAIDAKHYKDSRYVRSMCEIYSLIAQNTMEPLTAIRHFNIADLEKALIKLSQEYPDGYRNLCQIFGIAPSKHISKPRQLPMTAEHRELLHLCSWGYIETFLPNILLTVEKVANKMYSTNTAMTSLDKAKYAHLFYLFIYSFDIMPYDLGRYYELIAEATIKQGKEIKSASEKLSIMYRAMREMHKKEAHSVFEAVMLNNAYEVFFKRMPDYSISIDMIDCFLEEILEAPERLKIKEFCGLLTAEEKEEFRTLNLEPLNLNPEIRALKEIIFPLGGWETDIMLFRCNPDTKFISAMKAAWKKFEQNDYEFGKGVEPRKKPPIYTQIMSGRTYSNMGYLYSKSPKRIRISDPNELWMMRFYLSFA